jgi:hypothetical protein
MISESVKLLPVAGVQILAGTLGFFFSTLMCRMALGLPSSYPMDIAEHKVTHLH